MDDLAAFISARLGEDEAMAKAASRDGERGEPAGGEHWRWVDNGTDKVITPDPAAEFIDADGPVSLRSAERYPSEFVGPLPHFALPYVDEADGGVAAHIARHDPARALRDAAAKRAMVTLHEHYPATTKNKGGPDFGCGLCHEERDYGIIGYGWCGTIRHLAAIWSDHPDYRPEWAPGPSPSTSS